MEKKTYTFQMQFKTVQKTDKGTVIEGFASTPDIDRYEDIVDPKAFEDALNLYMTNPIILLQHNPEWPIGKVLEAKITDRGLFVKAVVIHEETEAKIAEEILRGFSIGFIPLDVKFRSKETGTDITLEEWTKLNYDESKKFNRVITKIDLIEISVVSTPANPHALFTMSKSFKIFFDEYKKTIMETKIFDETENEIRYRIRPPEDFEEDSFKQITLKEDEPRIFAVIGKLKGEDSTSLQSVRFPKEYGWTMESATAWVEEHKDELKKTHSDDAKSYKITLEDMKKDIKNIDKKDADEKKEDEKETDSDEENTDEDEAQEAEKEGETPSDSDTDEKGGEDENAESDESEDGKTSEEEGTDENGGVDKAVTISKNGMKELKELQGKIGEFIKAFETAGKDEKKTDEKAKAIVETDVKGLPEVKEMVAKLVRLTVTQQKRISELEGAVIELSKTPVKKGLVTTHSQFSEHKADEHKKDDKPKSTGEGLKALFKAKGLEAELGQRKK